MIDVEEKMRVYLILKNKTFNKTFNFFKTMIVLSTRKWATIKRTAQIVQPNVAKKAKLEAKIKELQEELDATDAAIMQFDSAIVSMTGYKSSDLIRRVVEPTSKTTEDGRLLTITKWVPTDIVVFDEEKNVYVVNDKTIEPTETPEVIENEINDCETENI